jgi:hypothetical protein
MITVQKCDPITIISIAMTDELSVSLSSTIIASVIAGSEETVKIATLHCTAFKGPAAHVVGQAPGGVLGSALLQTIGSLV